MLGNAGYGISLIFISASFLSQTNAVFSASLKQTPPFLTLIIGILGRGYYRKEKRRGKREERKRKIYHRVQKKGIFQPLGVFDVFCFLPPDF
jgi:UDP-N-acetylmuramyl pentapeptide phosphotransferase/UDP-N-acetylglucosamine-1-phosphate transferase